MQSIFLPDSFQPLLCLKPQMGRVPRDALRIEIRGVAYTLPEDLMARAAGLSVDALFDGGMIAIGLHSRDAAHFAHSGFEKEWAVRYKGHLVSLMRHFQEGREAGYTADTARFIHGGPSAQDVARDLLRDLLKLAQPAGLREELTYGSADLQSYAGVRDALWEARGKLQVPEFRDRLIARGMTEARLAQLEGLGDALFEERCAHLLWQGQSAGASDLIQVLKAMALGDLTMLSQTARAHLPQERGERYQIGRLLGTAPRDRREEPAPQPPAAPVAPLTSPMVAATEGAAPRLPAGTVLCTLPAREGPALVAIVQPDGIVTWTPASAVTTAAATTTTTAARIDQAAGTPAPAPKRSRRR